jgi:hypothetical protein
MLLLLPISKKFTSSLPIFFYLGALQIFYQYFAIYFSIFIEIKIYLVCNLMTPVQTFAPHPTSFTFGSAHRPIPPPPSIHTPHTQYQKWKMD